MAGVDFVVLGGWANRLTKHAFIGKREPEMNPKQTEDQTRLTFGNRNC